MSDLTLVEKRKLERALGMETGYVLNFSNRTFGDFFLDGFGVNIYDARYEYASGSKANRMRAFWDKEPNHLVARVLGLLLDEWNEFKAPYSPAQPPEECIKIVARLKHSADVADIGAVVAGEKDGAFETIARSVRECIDRNEPEAGLDRLHTFVTKYFRLLCERRGIQVARDKPLHSLVGEYVRVLRSKGLIESEMTERILKSTISIMEAFNKVRNDQSLAHDNKILNYDESLLIFGHVASSVRFIEALEARARKTPDSAPSPENDEIPF